MGLRALRNGIKGALDLLRPLNDELERAADTTDRIAGIPFPTPRFSTPSGIGDAPQVSLGGGGGGGGVNGGGGGSGGGTGLTSGGLRFPSFVPRGRPAIARTIEDLNANCRLQDVPVPSRVALPGAGETRRFWVCPDGSQYPAADGVLATISAESRGGVGPTGDPRANERIPITTTGPAGGADVGSRRRRQDPSRIPGSGGLSSGPVVDGLKAVQDSVEGLRNDIRRGDGGTGARARGDL